MENFISFLSSHEDALAITLTLVAAFNLLTLMRDFKEGQVTRFGATLFLSGQVASWIGLALVPTGIMTGRIDLALFGGMLAFGLAPIGQIRTRLWKNRIKMFRGLFIRSEFDTTSFPIRMVRMVLG